MIITLAIIKAKQEDVRLIMQSNQVRQIYLDIKIKQHKQHKKQSKKRIGKKKRKKKKKKKEQKKKSRKIKQDNIVTDASERESVESSLMS